MFGYIYILRSLKNNRFYIGSTNNLTRRLAEHKGGLSKYTKNNLPVNLEFFQKYPTIKLARQIEFRLKRLKRRDIIEKIIKEKNIKLEL
ncbi:GIY-YIG nuclease family protein [Patescibacteria group bacterium]|nr:GIY-YIG nuclease family protein [Patescibacteria group bacterium]